VFSVAGWKPGRDPPTPNWPERRFSSLTNGYLNWWVSKLELAYALACDEKHNAALFERGVAV